MTDLFWSDEKPSFWSRLCARCVDYTLLYLVFSLFTWLLPFDIEGVYFLLMLGLIPLVFAPIEALCISLWKKTLGKALFSIRVEGHHGEALPFGISLKRALFLGRRPGVMRQKKRGWIRSFIGALSLSLLLSGAYFEKEIASYTTGFESYASVKGWQEYTSSDGRFSVNFPKDPEFEAGKLPVPSHQKTLEFSEFKSHDTTKVYYSVSYIEFPKKWKMAGASRLLKGALEILMEADPSSELLHQEQVRHGPFKAIDYWAKQGEREVQGRLVIVGTTLYRLTAVYDPVATGRLETEAFIESFTFHG